MLTFDSVTIASDFDLKEILECSIDSRSAEDIEELRLYYVACTRARLQINNATHL